MISQKACSHPDLSCTGCSNAEPDHAGFGNGSAALSAEATGPALRKLEREAIAAATHISYPQSELLFLIHEHLSATGMHAAAHALAQDAGLAIQQHQQQQQPPPSRLAVQRDLLQVMEEAGDTLAAEPQAAAHARVSCPPQSCVKPATASGRPFQPAHSTFPLLTC